MAMKKGSKFDCGYATIDDDGINYREIADTMTHLGYRMNHSSARNHVLRIMRKFVEAIAEKNGMALDDAAITNISKSPMFQSGVADLLQDLEAHRKNW